MLISIAVDFRHANVATRERFHLTPERIARTVGRAAERLRAAPEAGAHLG